MNKAISLGLLALLVLSCCLMTSAVLAAEVVCRVVAVVDDEVITNQDLERILRTMQAELQRSGSAASSSQDLAQLRRLALAKLIDDKIFEREVKRHGLVVRPQELDAYIERIKQKNNLTQEAFVAQLSRRGITPEEYREELRIDILKHKLVSRIIKSRVVISDKQVEDYYNSHADEYGKMGGVQLRAIFLQAPPEATPAAVQAVRQKAEELRQQVVDGEDFAKLAREHSQGPGADQGGELGPLQADDLLPAMRQALAEMAPKDVSPVIKIPSGFVFMQLLGSSGKSGLPPAEIREQIRNKLESQAFEKLFRQWIERLKAKTYVKVMDE